jgi:hypothetical protein
VLVESDPEVPVSAGAQAAVRAELEAAGVEFTNGEQAACDAPQTAARTNIDPS